jgi:hypothetical protein
VPDKLSFDDIDELYQSAETAGRPLAVADDLIAAVEQDRLADAADASYALLAAAGIFEAQRETERAIELAHRAMLADGADAHDRHIAQATYGRLLIGAGRDDEGMATLTALRPALLTDPPLIEFLTDILIDLDRSQLAHEWLTDAVEQTKEAVAAAPEAEGTELLEVFYQLLNARHAVRHALDLPHDGYDELFQEMSESGHDDEEPLLIFWPRPDFDALLDGWPKVAEFIGHSWDEHRALMEKALVEVSESSATPPVLLAGSVDGLIAFAAEQDEDSGPDEPPHDPGDLDVLLEYADSIESPALAWPPGRNEDCWCGSGLKYKKCCLPRARL